ncbi:response regulator [Massilia cavernae]|uniref:Response regulator n=2 Tax=Massilia cavernae TaxID=2320864 RepID=A0A418XR91_9BURK|nr:response regulator [Massilia cavernae]
MLLSWGDAGAAVFNTAFAQLAGTDAPGGRSGQDLPAPLAAFPGLFERARHGEAVQAAGQQLSFACPGGERTLACDLYLTPLAGEDGKPGGVLCALGACTVAQAPAPEHRQGLRILVVEDNLDSQYLVCEMLKAFGHDAEGVADGESALAMLRAASYHVLFSDVSLPGMSGVELARQAVVMHPLMKVIFASGYGDTLLRHLDFPYVSLQKPYDMEHLQTALDAISRQVHG